MTTYQCNICKTKPDLQKSHHNKHIKSKKHLDKKRILELELQNMTPEDRVNKYGNNNIQKIIDSMETVVNDDTSEILITNSDSLREHIHSIHNYLRNHGGGYGLNALKIFNIFYGIKKLEDYNLNDQIGLNEEYSFSTLLTKSKTMNDEDFHQLIVDGLLGELYKVDRLKEFLFYEIPKNIKSDVFRYLIGEINNITKIEKASNVLLSGKVYEYFVGRDASAISELGAYFSNRYLVDFTINKVNPQLDVDGNIQPMVDMFGGSGGFTTGYINHLNNKDNIDWKSNVNKVFHYDINEDVLKAAALEIFCLTGQLPNMENIAYKNSFKTEFNSKYKYILTNPPYGGDKSKKTQAQISRDKVKEYIKSSPERLEAYSQQLKDIASVERKDKKEKDKNKVSLQTCSQIINDYARQFDLSGNDKESCSLILMMATLDIDGTCAAIVKEGVMFNRTYKKLRKCLIENFNVTEVISVQSNQFENTTTKTSILVFINSEEKTTKIKFSKLDVVTFKEDQFEERNQKIFLKEMKGDVSGCQEIYVSTATIQEIHQNPIYSLNGKDYNQTEITCGDDYELVKMKDLCEFVKYKSEKPNKGPYNYYSCSNNINKCSKGNISGEYVLMGTRGTITEAIHYYSGKFGCGNSMLVFNSDKLNNQYIYFILSTMKDLINNLINGSTIPMITLGQMKDLKIPVPKNPEKIQQWVDKISQPYNEKNIKKARIQELEKTIQERIQSICDNEDCEEVELGSVCEILPTVKHYTNIGSTSGLYRFYNSSQNNKLFVDFCEINELSLIIGQGGIVNIHIDTNFTPSKHVAVLQIINKNYNWLKYYYYLLKHQISSFDTNGSTIQWLNKKNIISFKIKLPKNKQLIDDMNPLFQEIEEHQQAVKDAGELYKTYINDLSNEAFPK